MDRAWEASAKTEGNFPGTEQTNQLVLYLLAEHKTNKNKNVLCINAATLTSLRTSGQYGSSLRPSTRALNQWNCFIFHTARFLKSVGK